jgi:DNA-binding MarR family transcriptional regulator
MYNAHMKSEVRQLHGVLLDLVGFMNQPQRDAALIREAGVSLDRALFPLLVVIERRGPIGVVELAGLVGRDYTTVSRQLDKLARRQLIARRWSPTDRRSRAAVITAKGRGIISALDAARERLASTLFAGWSDKDKKHLLRLMRRFTDDLMNLPYR